MENERAEPVSAGGERAQSRSRSQHVELLDHDSGPLGVVRVEPPGETDPAPPFEPLRVIHGLEAEGGDVDVDDARLPEPSAGVTGYRNPHPALVLAGPVPSQHGLLGELTDEADAVHAPCSVLYARGVVCRRSVCGS